MVFSLRCAVGESIVRHSPCQIEVVEKSGERPYLLCHEDTSKNHPGGLKGRKTTPKVVSDSLRSIQLDKVSMSTLLKLR